MTSKSGRRHPTERKRSAFRAQICSRLGPHEQAKYWGRNSDQLIGSAVAVGATPLGAKVLAEANACNRDFSPTIHIVRIGDSPSPQRAAPPNSLLEKFDP